MNSSLRNAPDPSVRSERIILVAIAFAAVPWVTLIWSQNPHKTLQFAIQAIELFVIFPVMFSSLPRSVTTIERALRAFMFLTGVLAVALMVVYLTNHVARVAGAYLPGLGKNPAGSYEAAGIVLAYAFLLRGKRGRNVSLAILLLDALGLAASESRGAMLGAAAGMLVVSLIMRRGITAVVVVLALFGALYFAVIAPGEAAKTSHSGSYSSATLRITLWKDALRKIEASPFLGTGARTYDDAAHGQLDPNNTFLLTWAEDGIVGLIVLIYMLFAFGQLAARWKRAPDPETAALAAACAGLFVAQLAHSMVDVSWVRGLSSLMFAALGLMIALERLDNPVPIEVRGGAEHRFVQSRVHQPV
jgi:O-antigen ligase